MLLRSAKALGGTRIRMLYSLVILEKNTFTFLPTLNANQPENTKFNSALIFLFLVYFLRQFLLIVLTAKFTSKSAAGCNTPCQYLRAPLRAAHFSLAKVQPG
jgi:hypothetical protein